MTKIRGTLGISVVGDRVEVRFHANNKARTAVLTGTEARAFAEHLLKAAKIADANGQPHGHA